MSGQITDDVQLRCDEVSSLWRHRARMYGERCCPDRTVCGLLRGIEQFVASKLDALA